MSREKAEELVRRALEGSPQVGLRIYLEGLDWVSAQASSGELVPAMELRFYVGTATRSEEGLSPEGGLVAGLTITEGAVLDLLRRAGGRESQAAAGIEAHVAEVVAHELRENCLNLIRIANAWRGRVPGSAQTDPGDVEARPDGDDGGPGRRPGDCAGDGEDPKA